MYGSRPYGDRCLSEHSRPPIPADASSAPEKNEAPPPLPKDADATEQAEKDPT